MNIIIKNDIKIYLKSRGVKEHLDSANNQVVHSFQTLTVIHDTDMVQKRSTGSLSEIEKIMVVIILAGPGSKKIIEGISVGNQLYDKDLKASDYPPVFSFLKANLVVLKPIFRKLKTSNKGTVSETKKEAEKIVLDPIQSSPN